MQDLSDAVPFIVERRVDAGKDLSIQGEADLEPMTEKKPTAPEVEDLLFANKIVKNSKSNAITLVKNKQLCASGIGQTSRVDSLKQAIEKAVSFNFDLNGAVMASDAFSRLPTVWKLPTKPVSPPLSSREVLLTTSCPLIIATNMVWLWSRRVFVILNTNWNIYDL